jgi:FkbM family methyltransferase
MNKATKSLSNHFRLFGLKGVLMRAVVGLGDRDNDFCGNIPSSSKKVHLRLGTTDVAAYEHVFIDDEYGFSLARSPSVIIDAGANIGMSAVYFSTQYPDATIVAIEPEPSNFDVLKKNAKLFPKIIPVNAALWNRDGVLQLQDGGGGHWGIRVVDNMTSSGSGIRAMTLTSLLDELQIGKVDLLKVDVEGAECEVFENVSPWISKVSVICAELHDRFRPGCSTIFEAATAEFPIKWRRGELHCVARRDWVLD